MSRQQEAILTVLCACVCGCSGVTPEHTSLLNRSTGETVGSANGTKPSRPIMPETFVASGRFLERQGDMAGAIEQYRKAIDTDSRFAKAHNCLGVAYQTLRQMRLARQAFDDGIRAAPNSALLRNNSGLCHAMLGRDEEAEEQFRDALDLDPDFDKARGNLAILLARNDRLGESYQEFRHVVSSVDAYTNIGIILLEQDSFSSAAAIFRNALEIEPTNQAAADGLDRAIAVSKYAEPPDVSETAAPAAASQVRAIPAVPPATVPAAVSSAPGPSVNPASDEAEGGVQVNLRRALDGQIAEFDALDDLQNGAVGAASPGEQPITFESNFPDDASIDPPNYRVVLASLDRPDASDRPEETEQAQSQTVPTIPTSPIVMLAAMGLAAFVTYVSSGTRERTSAN